MEAELLATLFGIAIFVALLFGGLWIPFAIATAGIVILALIAGPSSLRALGLVTWSSMNGATLSAIPLFILMADLLLRAGVSDRFYKGLAVLARRLPGGLLQTNIVGCALFSAISGSSMATAAAIGTVAIPQLNEKGYDPKMTAGSLAAGGTLGVLIPPSIAMILYGTFAEVSIAKLFLAGVVPGIVVTLIFMAYIAARVVLNPGLVPARDGARAGLAAIATALAQVVPVVLLMGVVLGTIYLGIATPTESAALGSVGGMVICALFGKFDLTVLRASLVATLRTSAAILFITMAAFIFAYAMEKSGVGRSLTNWITSLGLSPTMFMLLLMLGYILLGFVVDSIGMIVLTVPLLIPALHTMGVDLIWFGILLVIAIEIGQISPPLGINLFVIESIARRGLLEVIRGTVPYIGLMILALAVIFVLPDLATWLPGRMTAR